MTSSSPPRERKHPSDIQDSPNPPRKDGGDVEHIPPDREESLKETEKNPETDSDYVDELLRQRDA